VWPFGLLLLMIRAARGRQLGLAVSAKVIKSRPTIVPNGEGEGGRRRGRRVAQKELNFLRALFTERATLNGL